MEKIRLRPHHVDLFIGNKDILSEVLEKDFIRSLYGDDFSEKLEKTKSRLRQDTLIEIVFGQDDLCKNYNCPYSDDCKDGNYKLIAKKMISRLPFNFPGVVEALDKKTPEIADKESIRKYCLEIGKVYNKDEIQEI